MAQEGRKMRHTGPQMAQDGAKMKQDRSRRVRMNAAERSWREVWELVDDIPDIHGSSGRLGVE